MGIEKTADPVNGTSGRLIGWLPIVLLALAIGAAFYDGLANMTEEWRREEYSHGWFIPLIAAFMVWRSRAELAALDWRGTWLGVAIVVLALALVVLGELSTLYIIIQYAFLLALAGVALALGGWSVLRTVAAPLIYLGFMIPLPNFLYNNLSQELQLISSAIGVWFMRLFDVSVFLEGNVIDLGVYQLQVVEACSGLRYLFPLMSFGFLCAYLFKAPFWQRAIVFLSAIPLTVLMNSFRIGVIGILVNSYGIEQAEGFLHYFEGWVIFMACVLVLFGEMWLLTLLTQRGRTFRDTFNLDFGRPAERRLDDFPGPRSQPRLIALVAVVAMAAVGLQLIGQRTEVVPDRVRFAIFPDELGEWRGTQESLPPGIVRALRADDYIVANYQRPGVPVPVNLYSAYYSSQRKGASIHSPRSCLPGNDWEIVNLSTRRIDGVGADGSPLDVNRVVIAKGDVRQLVYYWFEQRGRRLTSEYAVKWYLLWDAIELNRTDGALVRLTIPIGPGMTVNAAEDLLQEFLRVSYPKLDPFIPN